MVAIVSEHGVVLSVRVGSLPALRVSWCGAFGCAGDSAGSLRAACYRPCGGCGCLGCGPLLFLLSLFAASVLLWHDGDGYISFLFCVHKLL